MSLSVDGYIAGPDDRQGQELGRGGGRLFNRLDDRMSAGVNGQVFGELMSTGALISPRRTFELAGRWQGDHHDGVPIHVLTRHIDATDMPPGSAKFYTDVNVCATEAREAAGDRAVMVHGAGAAQALLAAGQLDELELHLVPVLLGDGRRLFEPPDSAPSTWSPSAGSKAATIAMSSVNTANRMRDDDLRSVNFFDVDRHPDMTFQSAGLDVRDGLVELPGELTVRGITRDVAMEVEFLGLDETGLQGEQRIGFSATTTIRRSDYGVGATAREGQKVVVGDMITIQLDIQAVLESRP